MNKIPMSIINVVLLLVLLAFTQPVFAGCEFPHLVDAGSESDWNLCPSGFEDNGFFYIMAFDHYQFGSLTSVYVRDGSDQSLSIPHGTLYCPNLNPDGYEVQRSWGSESNTEQLPYYSYAWYNVNIGWVSGALPNTSFHFVNNKFVSGCNHTWGSPIVISFQPKVEFTSPKDGVNFDIQQFGFPQRVAWTKADANIGWLVRGTNIKSTEQMFGDMSLQAEPRVPNEEASGYRALRLYDSDGDLKITPTDAIWVELNLWFDRNHNGVAETDELESLDDAGVGSISLQYDTIGKRDRYGTTLHFRSEVQLKTGTSKFSYDVVPAMIGSTAGTETTTVTRSGTSMKRTGVQPH